MSIHSDRQNVKARAARTFTVLVGGAAILGLTWTAPAAAVDPELRGGYYTDAGHAFIGGGLNMSVAESWDFNPNLEWVFADNVDYFTVNADLHRDLNGGSSGPAVWLGGGPALVVVNRDDSIVGESDTDVDLGLNLLGGIGAKRGAVRPFGQLKLMVSDDSQTSLALGVRF